ncbi:MAG: pseudouridine synthase, partial [Oscillospiraceae bacterium]|nr:pseudouridine synthase [Oscillospiraceae bacterium]
LLLRGEDAGLRLFAVGRLDADTEGLLILTNDGGLNERIARPEREVGKTYYAEFDRPLCSDAAELLAQGVILRNGEKCRPAKISFTGEKSAYITVTEGKYHEIKRIANACGAYVAYLKRVSIGGLTLDASLKPGEYRRMTAEETERIFASEYNME